MSRGIMLEFPSNKGLMFCNGFFLNSLDGKERQGGVLYMETHLEGEVGVGTGVFLVRMKQVRGFIEFLFPEIQKQHLFVRMLKQNEISFETVHIRRNHKRKKKVRAVEPMKVIVRPDAVRLATELEGGVLHTEARADYLFDGCRKLGGYVPVHVFYFGRHNLFSVLYYGQSLADDEVAFRGAVHNLRRDVFMFDHALSSHADVGFRQFVSTNDRLIGGVDSDGKFVSLDRIRELIAGLQRKIFDNIRAILVMKEEDLFRVHRAGDIVSGTESEDFLQGMSIDYPLEAGETFVVFPLTSYVSTTVKSLNTILYKISQDSVYEGYAARANRN